ncbi:MAG: creatininase family protein [Thermoplasmata archaeon]|nr:creatininase family protein [Thermoplasmata archaeon]
MNIDDMSSPEFADAVENDPVVILPLGALEEHGSHLPLSTDMLQPLAVVNKAAERARALVLPPMPYGLCSSTRNFPGTVSLSFDTLRAFAKDIVMELDRNGVRRILFVSGHAGRQHMAALKQGVSEALEAIDEEVLVLVLSDYDFAYARKDLAEDDGHAGMLETSRVLALSPELVGDERPVCHPVFPRFRVLKDASRIWPEGMHGDTTDANVEYGEEVNLAIVEALVDVIEAMKMEMLEDGGEEVYGGDEEGDDDVEGGEE